MKVKSVLRDVVSKFKLYKKRKFGKHTVNYSQLIEMGSIEKVILDFSIDDRCDIIPENEKPAKDDETIIIRKHFKELTR